MGTLHTRTTWQQKNGPQIWFPISAYELQRWFVAHGVSAISVGCHPGYAETNLQAVGSRMAGSRVRETLMKVANRALAQSAEMGALPTLYATVAEDVNGCDYIGPTGLMAMRGYPAKARSNDRSYDGQLAQRLWRVSEELTGVSYAR